MIVAIRKCSCKVRAVNFNTFRTTRANGMPPLSVQAAHFGIFNVNDFIGLDYRPDPMKARYKQVGDKLLQLPEMQTKVATKEDIIQLKLEMKMIFLEREISRTKFDRIMRERLTLMNPEIIAYFMRICGRKTGDENHIIVTRKHLSNIAAQIEATTSSFLWDYVKVAFVMNGLQTVDGNHPGFLKVLSAIARVTNRLNTLTGKFPDSQNISMFLLGLQNSNGDEKPTDDLLIAAAGMVNKCSDTFTRQTVGTTLYSLKTLTSKNPNAVKLLAALIPHVEKCDDVFNNQSVGTSLFGLQGFSSRHPEVLQMLHVLLKKVNSCDEGLQSQAIGNALYGFKNMSSEPAEVRVMLTVLAGKIRESKGALSSESFGAAIYGLQSMNSCDDEVREVVKVLTDKVRTYKTVLNSIGIASAVYGMQGMTCEYQEVRDLLALLTIKIKESSYANFDNSQIGGVFFGLQQMSSETPEVRDIVVALTRKTELSKDDMTDVCLTSIFVGLSNMDSEDVIISNLLEIVAKKTAASPIVFTPNGLCYCISELEGYSSDSAGVRAILAALTLRLTTIPQQLVTEQLRALVEKGLRDMEEKHVEVAELRRVLKMKFLKTEFFPIERTE